MQHSLSDRDTQTSHSHSVFPTRSESEFPSRLLCSLSLTHVHLQNKLVRVNLVEYQGGFSDIPVNPNPIRMRRFKWIIKLIAILN